MNRTTAILLLLAIIVFLVTAVFGFVLIGQQEIEGQLAATPAGATAPTEASSAPNSDARDVLPSTWEPHPTSTLSVKVLTYPHFTIGYDEIAKNPAWVAYHLAGPITNHGSEKRPSTFATDFGTAAHVAHHDYSNSGFDRGHLVPAYAMFSRFGDEGMKSTFIMSNVIPQYHGLNAGEWELLETMIAGRDGREDGWAATYGAVWVINGPIYEQRPAPDQLRNGTWIPSACFSVVLRQVEGRWNCLAVVMPNQKNVAGPVGRYLTTIAVIERESHIAVLAGMAADEETRLKQQRAAEVWR